MLGFSSRLVASCEFSMSRLVVVEGMQVEHDQTVIESLKKKLMSTRLSESLLFVVRHLIADNNSLTFSDVQ